MESKRSFNLVTVSMSENCLHVGDRIEDASTNSRGTIRYIGPVATSNDDTMVYYGVEWDEWGRGLNDGSVTLPNGEKKYYFQGLLSRSSKTKTLEFKFSFVKKNKMISEKMCQRTTLIEMLQERYAHENENEKDSLHHLKDIVIAGEVGTAFGKEKPIELVGVKKLRTQQKLETIEKISLSNCKIASIGNFVPGTLGKMTPNITELNLSFNLFTKWSDIFQLIHELPLLESLILSGNRLIYDIQEKELEKKLFTKIQVLVLNNTSISWKQIKEIVKCHFSSLKELYVAENEIKDDDLVLPLSFCSSSLSELPETLETLDLSHNLLQDWQTICKAFGSLTNLKQLVLNGNQIQTIVTKNASSTTSAIPIVSSVSSVPFSNLESISLTDNLVDSWTSIDELNKYKKLNTLRFMRNPLIDHMGIGEARMIMIARAQYLMVFNGSEVRLKERKDAEQLYLKRILYELEATCGLEANIHPTNSDVESEKNRILSLHPRYEQLALQYPEIVDALIRRGIHTSNNDTTGGGPCALSSTLVRVQFIPMSMKASCFEPLEKKIPEKIRIAQLKLLVKNKFSIEPHEQLLSFRSNPKSLPIHLDDDNCEVGYYGIQDGGEILINDI